MGWYEILTVWWQYDKKNITVSQHYDCRGHSNMFCIADVRQKLPFAKKCEGTQRMCSDAEAWS